MKVQDKWMPLFLSAAVFPGAGQWFLGRRFKGALIMGVTLLLMMGGIARYLAVVFATANKHGVHRAPQLNPLPLLGQAWSIDHKVLTAFLAGLFLVWLLSILDLLAFPKEEKLS
ncbi:MAG: hypothetical protein K8R69_05310 [Deltaproteobacteria bacterium]|nr:hypothetical protein [Deltaproteobacteria bacterium]